MKQKTFWLRALNVRPEEGWLVKKLFLLQFFQGAGIAFFFTSSFALFLARFSITELPWVFIYSSVLLWAFGFIYSKIEHHFAISKLAIIITVFMVVCMLLFRFAFVFIKSGWFLYWMMAWFNVFYLLNNLEFWGLASLLFDARQSKRLFGVISAGDIPAKFIGYSVALLTVQYVGTINLLWAGIICMLASIPFLISIRKSGVLHEEHQPHAKKHHHPHKPTAGDVKKIVKNFSGNILIRRLSMLSIIVTGSFIITNFAFYAGVKEAYHDDVSLAKFIALFLAVVRIIAMVVKMIFTSRLINNLGIIKSLLITPIVMLLLLFGIVFTQNLPGYQKIIIYLFGGTSIVVDILRSAISTPVFLTIMQPLPNHERLRAHTIVKGIMDPFASLLTGVMLLVLIHYQREVNLLTLTYILLVVCVFWIIGIYRINSQYLKTVIKTLSNRYFSRDDFSIADSGTQNWLKEKVKTASETEGINILNMLAANSDKTSSELIIDALQHPSDNVKIAALKLMQQKEYPDAESILLPFLQHSSPAIVAESLKILCKNKVDNAIIVPYLKNTNDEIKLGALEGLFYYGASQSKAAAHALLCTMIASDKIKDRLAAATILNTHDNNETDLTLQLMNDMDDKVKKTAFSAAGKSGNKVLLKELMSRIESDEAEIIQALQISGERSLPYIFDYIMSKNARAQQKEKLIFLLGRIGGKRGEKMLLDLFANQPEEYINLIKALYRSRYTPAPEEQAVFIDAARDILSRCASIIYMQSSLETQFEKYHLLVNSFHLELISLRESLLYVFALLYGHENINRVRTAFATGKKETIINAMEIIDIAVRKDLAIEFNIIFEPGNIRERMQSLRKNYPPELFNNAEEVLVRILAAETKLYNNWTTACSLYTTKKQHHNIEEPLIKKYTAAENKMVRETAYYAAAG